MNSYYYKAVCWAYEMGITEGTGETIFSPNKTCTRGEIVTFLWAVENEITNGKTETTFGPDDPCTRAQAVTFLYRAKQRGPGSQLFPE